MSVCRNAVSVFCSIILYVVFSIIYFVRILFSVFLHAVFYAICKVSLFLIIILQLLVLCTVKLANIGYTVYRTPPNSGYFCLERQDFIENTYKWSSK